MGDSARLCLFCLEKRTNRQKIFCIENLFGCECKAYCHAKCMKKWHQYCGDDLQCPICRHSIFVENEDENEVDVETIQFIVIYMNQDLRRELIKKVLRIVIYIYLSLQFLLYFTYRRPS